jgi:hypothetical protein
MMNKRGLRNLFFRCLLLIFIFAQLVACSISQDQISVTPALIVQDGSGDPAEMTALTTLAALMTKVGYTIDTNVGFPAGDLSGYVQIWDIRYFGSLSNTDQSNYLIYLMGGGTLVLTGGYSSSSANNRDVSIVTLINDLGGGPITLANSSDEQAQTVLPAFTSPSPVNHVNYTYGNPIVDGTTTPGKGTFITEYNGSFGSAIYYNPGTLAGAPAGTLIVVFDINFLNPDNPDYITDFGNLAVNMLLL